MLSAGPLALGRPLTHSDVLAAAAQLGNPAAFGHLCVQARRYDKSGPYWLCAEVLALGGSEPEWFKVSSAIDTWWALGRDLRLCSPDGRCACDSRAILAKRPGRQQRPTTQMTPTMNQQPRGLPLECTDQPAEQLMR